MQKPIAAVVGGLAALMWLAVPEASALKWASRDSPLVAYADGVAQAKGHGNFFNKDGIWARSKSFQYDPRPGGDAVTVKTTWWWLGPDSSCGVRREGGYLTCWHTGRGDDNKQTADTDSAVWVEDYRQRYLEDGMAKVRGHMRVCENQSFSPDDCSVQVLRTFAY